MKHFLANTKINVTSQGLTNLKHSLQKDVPKGSLKYYYGPDKNELSTGAFTVVTATPTAFTVTYYDYSGAKLYEATSTR